MKKLSEKKEISIWPPQRVIPGRTTVYIHLRRNWKNYNLPKSFQIANISLKRRASCWCVITCCNESLVYILEESPVDSERCNYFQSRVLIFQCHCDQMNFSFMGSSQVPLFQDTTENIHIKGVCDDAERKYYTSASVMWVSRPSRYQTLSRKQVHRLQKAVPQLPSSTQIAPLSGSNHTILQKVLSVR